MSIFSSYMHLREIVLLGENVSCRVNDDVLTVISQHCSHLSMLHSYLSDAVTDAGRLTLGEGYSVGITDLELGSNAREEDCLITDSSIGKLFQRQKLIKHLSIHIPTITDLSMISIAKNCKQLEYLYISYMSHVTDISMIRIAEQCKDLREIWFYYLDGITDISIVAISQNCDQLMRVDLWNCHAISDVSMQAMAENCRHLTDLGLHRISGIIDPCYIVDIARNNIKLLYNCIEVTMCGVPFEGHLQGNLWAITSGR